MAATGVNKMAAMFFFSGVLPWLFFVDLDGCHKCVVAHLYSLKIACLVFFRPRSIAQRVIAMVSTFSKVPITPKRLHLEHFCKICCSATFSMPTRWYHF